jgi:hypothetical protein
MYVPRFRTASSHRLVRAKAITALATASLVLAAAGSASAEPKQSAPAKKGCEVQLKGEGAGQSIVYADGYSFSVYAKSDSKTHTYTCNDGKWSETVSLTASPLHLGGVAAPIATGGTFQVLDPGAGQFDSRVGAVSSSANYLVAMP